MKTWPPRLNAKLFIKAAKCLEPWTESSNTHCALNAIKCANGVDNVIQCYVAKAFFSYLFRPNRPKPSQPWWPKHDFEARLLALCFAAELAADYEFQLGADGMIQVFRECSRLREKQFEVGQAALLSRALAAENRPLIDAPLRERLAYTLRNL